MSNSEPFIYLKYSEGSPTGWWYERVVPKLLRRPLGRRNFRRFLGANLNQAHWRYREVDEEVQRLLGLSTGTLQLRKREVRLVAKDCAREFQQQFPPASEWQLPGEEDLAELLVNAFRARGLVLDADCFPLARETFCAQLRQPLDHHKQPGGPTTVAGWVAQRSQRSNSAVGSELLWHRELKRLLSFSEVSLPAAVSEGAAWRWRNHLFANASTSTAQKRLTVIRAFYAQAYRQGMVAMNPFAGLEPLPLSPRPEPNLAPAFLQLLDGRFKADPIYLMVRILGLRSLEVAGLRPIDWGLQQGQPVLWIRSWGLQNEGRPCRAGQERCLPLPNCLHGLWKQCSGSAETPLWAEEGADGINRFAKRWAAAFRRQGGCSASALRRYRQSQWQIKGADGHVLNRLLGTLAASRQPGWDQVEGLEPWLQLAAAEFVVAQP